jgi:hypothetical protein
VSIAVHPARPSLGLLAFALRLARGAAHNFAIRVSDWFAACVLLSFGLSMLTWSALFAADRSFALLWQYGSPAFWGWACVLVGFGRVCALTINGTFPGFPWSPHVRLAMAMLSVFVWFQITLGVLSRDGGTVMIAFYPNLFLFDLYNLFLTASEASAAERRNRHAGA